MTLNFLQILTQIENQVRANKIMQKCKNTPLLLCAI